MSRQSTPPGSPQARFVASCPSPVEGAEHSIGARRANKNAGGKTSGVSVTTVVHGLLIVVEPALARLIITLPSRTVGRTALMAPRGLGDLAAAAVKTTCRWRSAGEIGAPVAHRAAIARTAARTGGRATIAATTAATTTVAAASSNAATAT